MENNQDTKKVGFSKLSKIIIILNIFLIAVFVLLGFFFSGGRWDFIIAMVPILTLLMLLSLVLVVANIYLVVLSLRYKNYKILIFSLLFVIIIPAPFYLPGIVRFLNRSEIEKTKQQSLILEQQYMKEEANAKILFDSLDKLMKELYSKVSQDIDGKHKIISIDPANLLITIDTGKTYMLNTDSIIRKTAAKETVDVYQEIMNGGYKNKIYQFSTGGYSSFKNYYSEQFRSEDEIKNAIVNFKTTIFVVSVPDVVN